MDSTPASYISTRQFGSARVSIISDGSGRSTIIKSLLAPESEWRPEVPEADADGEIVLGYNVALVEIGDARVLIDTGFDDATNDSQWKAPRHNRSPGVPAGLAALGLTPADITHVVFTHAHGDHFAGSTHVADGQRAIRYANATHFLGRSDWESNPHRLQTESFGYLHLKPLVDAGKLELVDGEKEIVPGVTMIHAPGESLGHSIVRVRSAGETFYFLGDLFHHPCEVSHLDWVSAGRDPIVFRASRERFLAEAVPAKATMVFTHRTFPGWGHIEPTSTGFRWIDD